MKRLKILIVAAAFLAGGWLLGSYFSGGGPGEAPESGGAAEGAGSAETWTCSMHPQIQQPKPGKCPICAMDLIPVSKAGGGDDEGPRVLALTETAKKLAEIRTVPVTRQLVETTIPLVGKIAFDETRTKTMAARFPARIDRLYVDYTGIQVREGDHLARVYSPDLLTAQRELLSAIKFGSNVETARDKLRLWGLSEERIKEIEEKEEPSDRMDINALIGGIVIEKHVNEGGYVDTGQALFTISDLGSVWVKLNAYESDMPWIRYGQPVTFEAEAVPGRQFEGIVAFLSPTLDPGTRTIQVRVNADNPRQVLKPEMFVHATIHSTLAESGKVVAPDLKGKWISPMHPEVIRDGPGQCPVCGMDLVKAEDLGYDVLKEPEQPPLVVPASAVLRTGKRSVVYVELPDREKPTYQGREIVIGPRAGDFYLVEEGLEEGERVVSEGNFKIDSALQIQAKPSMMNPGEDSGTTDKGAAPEQTPAYEVSLAFRENLGTLLADYLRLQGALANDDFAAAKKEAGAAEQTLPSIGGAELEGEAQKAWQKLSGDISGALARMPSAKDIAAVRTAFEPLSNALREAVKVFQPTGHGHVYELHCPMAFDFKGASWLQDQPEVLNPYFGAEMLTCGSVRRQLLDDAGPGAEDADHAGHEHGK